MKIEIIYGIIIYVKAGIAQLVEQRTENPRVTSSNLVPGNFKGSNFWGGRIRTSEWRDQNPQPYRLATPQIIYLVLLNNKTK